KFQFFTTIFEDSRGIIWAGTWRDGLYYYHPEKQKGGLYMNDVLKNKSLSNNRITRIFEDSDKRLWIGTEGGLCELNRSTNQFEIYTREDGLPGNLILFLLEEDNTDFLWISTSERLAR